jgi:hypothetical protein
VTPGAVYLRLGGALLALAAGAVGAVVVIALLRSVPGPVGATTAVIGNPAAEAPAGPSGGSIPTPSAPGFPAPPPGAIVLAREAGVNALGLAVVPGEPRSLLRASVVSPSGAGASGLEVTAAAGAAGQVALAACGPGCYQGELATGGSRLVRVTLNGRSYDFTLPAQTHPPDGTGTVHRANAVWRALRTLVWHERLDGLHNLYIAVAPDQLQYTIAGTSQAIIIGARRWDRPSPTAPWTASPQLPITQPVPFWYAVADARTLGSARVGGRSVWTVSFFDPTTPAWFEAEIDKATGRTLELSMIAASHFMYDTYGPFNAPIRLRPPTSKT